ncbi:MAG: pyruvate formate lyase family protein [Bacilli bacterium]
MFNFKKNFPFIFDEFTNSNFNQKSGLKPEDLKRLIDDYYETHPDVPYQIRRAETLALLLRNCQIEVNPYTPFADKYNLGISYKLWGSESFYDIDCRRKLYMEYDKKCPEAWHDRYLMDKIGLGAPDNDLWHTVPEWEYVIDNGFAGLRDIAHAYFKNATAENRLYYQSVVIIYDAIIDYMKRLEIEAVRVGNRVFAKCMRDLQIRAPETLYEAMETSLLFMQLEQIGIERCRSLGNLDIIYRKFIQKAYEEMDKEELCNLVRYFLTKINAEKRYANQPICIGGLDEDFNCPSGDFTILLLQIYRELSLSNPKIHVRYNDKMREDVFDEIINCLNTGSTSIVIISDRVIMEGYKKIGIMEEESRNFLPLGCYENTIPELEDARICSCWINLYKPVEWAATGGQELSGNESLFPKEKLDNSTWEKFLNNYFYYLNKVTERVKKSVMEQERVGRHFYASPLLSGALSHCMKTGRDIFDGGLKYNNASMKYCCTGSAIDALLAIKHFVFKNKKITLEEFCKTLQNNWENNPLLRVEILKSPYKHGSGNEEAGELLKIIFDYIEKMILNKPDGWGGVYRVGTDSVENSDRFGLKCIASFDGRLAYTPFSKNMRPVNGMEHEGLTGFMRNLLMLDQTSLINGAPLDFVLHPSSTQGEKGFYYFKEIIRYYLNHGGNTIMGNVLDINTLLEAQKNPENYQNLQVRVCGWNEYFVQMSPLLQNDFIERARNCQ